MFGEKQVLEVDDAADFSLPVQIRIAAETVLADEVQILLQEFAADSMIISLKGRIGSATSRYLKSSALILLVAFCVGYQELHALA